MAVSRFFQDPIQNHFSEIQKLHQNPLSRVLEPSGVSGSLREPSGLSLGGVLGAVGGNPQGRPVGPHDASDGARERFRGKSAPGPGFGGVAVSALGGLGFSEARLRL